MKKSNILLFLAVSYLCSSCLGGLLSPDAIGGGSMTCNVNGSSWKASDATGINILGSITVTGTSGTGKNTSTILLAFDKANAKAGTVIDLSETNLSLGSSLTSYTASTNGVDITYGVTEGSIKITSASGSKIAGTFSFTGIDFTGKNKDVKVENGKFSASLLL